MLSPSRRLAIFTLLALALFLFLYSYGEMASLNRGFFSQVEVSNGKIAIYVGNSLIKTVFNRVIRKDRMTRTTENHLFFYIY